MSASEIKRYLARIGKAGGSAKGSRKKRGDAEYYRQLARKAWAKRKEKNEKTTRVDVFAADGLLRITPINCDCVVIQGGVRAMVRRGSERIVPDDGQTFVRIATAAEKRKAKREA